VELVKTRAYGEGEPAPAESARATLALALSILLRMFAPFIPFVTEEVWHWWQAGSIHRATWPTPAEFAGRADGDAAVLSVAGEVLSSVRRSKTAEKRSMRARVAELVVSGPPSVVVAVEAARGDLIDAGGVDQMTVQEAQEFSVSITLAEES